MCPLSKSDVCQILDLSILTALSASQYASRSSRNQPFFGSMTYGQSPYFVLPWEAAETQWVD